MRGSMWKQLWKKWTLDKPAVLGDWLWDVFVVQLAAFLDRLTLRQIIALIPVVILVLAYAHSIPLPPELMLVGDLLAYIDIFTMIFLLGVVSRVSTILYLLKQAVAHAVRLLNAAGVRRPDLRHRRDKGTQRRKRAGRPGADDDRAPVCGLVWA